MNSQGAWSEHAAYRLIDEPEYHRSKCFYLVASHL